MFSIFIPSARKILFFQKKIKLLNEEFMVDRVCAQTKDNFAFVVDTFPTKPNTTKRPIGMDITTTQAAASKQDETFFKFILLLFCGVIALLRRFCLEIRYNL